MTTLWVIVSPQKQHCILKGLSWGLTFWSSEWTPMKWCAVSTCHCSAQQNCDQNGFSLGRSSFLSSGESVGRKVPWSYRPHKDDTSLPNWEEFILGQPESDPRKVTISCFTNIVFCSGWGVAICLPGSLLFRTAKKSMVNWHLILENLCQIIYSYQQERAQIAQRQSCLLSLPFSI